MIHFTQLLFQIGVMTYAATIFPKPASSLRQFEQAIWMDCASSTSIQGSNCLDDEYLWQECYKIPQNGACFKQNIKTNLTTPLNVQIDFFNLDDGKEVQFVLGGTKMTGIVKDNYIRVNQAFNSDITLKVLTSNIFLSNLTISQECLPYCSACDGGYCQNCMPGYYLFSYQCVRNDCDAQLKSLTTTSLKSSSGALKDGYYEVAITLDVELGDCLVPKIYLAKSLLDNSIVYVIQDSELTVESRQVNVKLSMNQVLKYCQQMELTNSITYQCFVNLALTFGQNTQYLLILIGQISIDRSTSAVSDTTQSIQLPDDNNIAVGPILVVSDQTATVIDQGSKTVSTVTVIADPNYQKYLINFSSAAFTQGGKRFDLTLLQQDQSAGKSTLSMKWIDSNFNPSQSYELQIYANVVPQKISRILIAQKSSLTNISFSIANTLKFNGTKEPQFELDDISICFLVVGSMIGLLLLLTLANYSFNANSAEQLIQNNLESDCRENSKKKQCDQIIPPATSNSAVV